MKEHILVIDDNKEIRETLSDIFTCKNYKVSTEPNGLLGIERALKEHPDLIICDISMPVMDGFQTMNEIKKETSLFGTPFIFLTAMVENKSIRKGMNLGADDYIIKPFSNEELLSVVKLRLEKRNQIAKDYKKRIKQLRKELRNQKVKIDNYAFLNSHELRGPLARIIGLIDLLLKEHLTDQEINNGMLINMLSDACKEMDSTIKEINEILSYEGYDIRNNKKRN